MRRVRIFQEESVDKDAILRVFLPSLPMLTCADCAARLRLALARRHAFAKPQAALQKRLLLAPVARDLSRGRLINLVPPAFPVAASERAALQIREQKAQPIGARCDRQAAGAVLFSRSTRRNKKATGTRIAASAASAANTST